MNVVTALVIGTAVGCAVGILSTIAVLLSRVANATEKIARELERARVEK